MSGLLMICSLFLPWRDDWSDLDYWSDNGLVLIYDLPFFFLYPTIGGAVLVLHIYNTNLMAVSALSIVGGIFTMQNFISTLLEIDIYFDLIVFLGPLLMFFGSFGVFVSGCFGYNTK